MKRLFWLICLLLMGKALVAEEMWVCRGYLYSDGSNGPPFVLRGDGRSYAYTVDVPLVIEHVANNKVVGFEIYVNTGKNTNRNAYYLRRQSDRLIIRKQHWELERSETDCVRQ